MEKTTFICNYCLDEIPVDEKYRVGGESYCEGCAEEARDDMNCEYSGSDFYDDDRLDFADPGGESALRAETEDNPRNLPCPSCREPNRLTPKDRSLGYQCDDCARRAEGYGD